MHKTILALSFILLAQAFPFDTANALVGADIADRTVQRYTVVIASQKGRCSGVVMAQDIVLTAAHCIQPGEKLNVGGTVGSGEQPLQAFLFSPVDKVVVHPLYKPTDAGSPDLAMLKLAKPLPDRFIAATLNARGLSVGDDLIAAGFGKTAERDSQAGHHAAHGAAAGFRFRPRLGDAGERRRRRLGRRRRRFRRADVFLSWRHAQPGRNHRRGLAHPHQGGGAVSTLRLDQGDGGEAERALDRDAITRHRITS